MKELQIKVKPEGRPNVWLPEKKSLINFIKFKKLKYIHNFIPNGRMIIGADHDVKSVIEDINGADRVAVFTDPNQNMGLSMALILGSEEKGFRLECYDIGKITESNLIQVGK